MENNKLQSIRHFEEHSEVPATDIKVAPAPKLPAGLFTNKPPAPMNGPVNVLLLDYLNTPLTSQPYRGSNCWTTWITPLRERALPSSA